MSAFRFFSCPDVTVVVVNRDQDLVEALDSGGSDMEMDRGIVQVQEHSAQHRAKMWKVEGIMRKVHSCDCQLSVLLSSCSFFDRLL